MGRSGNAGLTSQIRTKSVGGPVSGPGSHNKVTGKMTLELKSLKSVTSPTLKVIYSSFIHLFTHSLPKSRLCSQYSARPRAWGGSWGWGAQSGWRAGGV